jgi:hypothetical protein
MTQSKRTSNGLWLDTDATRNDGADRGHGMNAEDSGRQMLSFDIYLKVNASRAGSFFKLQASRAKGRKPKIPNVPVCGEAESGGVW